MPIAVLDAGAAAPPPVTAGVIKRAMGLIRQRQRRRSGAGIRVRLRYAVLITIIILVSAINGY